MNNDFETLTGYITDGIRAGWIAVPYTCSEHNIKGVIVLSGAKRELFFAVLHDQWVDGYRGVVVYDSSSPSGKSGLTEGERYYLERVGGKMAQVEFVDFKKVEGRVLRNDKCKSYEFLGKGQRVYDLPRLVRCYLTVRSQYASSITRIIRAFQ